MTSTPNSSFDIIENRNCDNGKTAHNAINRRKSKRRTPAPLIVSFFFLTFYISNHSFVCLDDSTTHRRNSNVFVTIIK